MRRGNRYSLRDGRLSRGSRADPRRLSMVAGQTTGPGQVRRRPWCLPRDKDCSQCLGQGTARTRLPDRKRPRRDGGCGKTSAASRTICTAGSRSPTRTPMIAITTKSSTSVKPNGGGRLDLALMKWGSRIFAVLVAASALGQEARVPLWSKLLRLLWVGRPAEAVPLRAAAKDGPTPAPGDDRARTAPSAVSRDSAGRRQICRGCIAD
jgi:hypothetical protein